MITHDGHEPPIDSACDNGLCPIPSYLRVVQSNADQRERTMHGAKRVVLLVAPSFCTLTLLIFTAPSIAIPCSAAALFTYPLTDRIATWAMGPAQRSGAWDDVFAGGAMFAAMALSIGVGLALSAHGSGDGYTMVSLGAHVALMLALCFLQKSLCLCWARLETDAQRFRALALFADSACQCAHRRE